MHILSKLKIQLKAAVEAGGPSEETFYKEWNDSQRKQYVTEHPDSKYAQEENKVEVEEKKKPSFKNNPDVIKKLQEIWNKDGKLGKDDLNFISQYGSGSEYNTIVHSLEKENPDLPSEKSIRRKTRRLDKISEEYGTNNYVYKNLQKEVESDEQVHKQLEREAFSLCSPEEKARLNDLGYFTEVEEEKKVGSQEPEKENKDSFSKEYKDSYDTYKNSYKKYYDSNNPDDLHEAIFESFLIDLDDQSKCDTSNVNSKDINDLFHKKISLDDFVKKYGGNKASDNNKGELGAIVDHFNQNLIV